MARSFLATYSHGSAETLDYSINWGTLLLADNDAASSVEWVTEFGEPTLGNGSNGAPAPSFASDVATIWVIGGIVGDKYHLTCKLTTSGGRIHERSIRIAVADK